MPSAWPNGRGAGASCIAVPRVDHRAPPPGPYGQPSRTRAAQTRQQDDESAQRYARLLVAEIKLYREAALDEARRETAILPAPSAAIERAERMYTQSVPGKKDPRSHPGPSKRSSSARWPAAMRRFSDRPREHLRTRHRGHARDRRLATMARPRAEEPQASTRCRPDRAAHGDGSRSAPAQSAGALAGARRDVPPVPSAVAGFRTGARLFTEARYTDALPLVSGPLAGTPLADYAQSYRAMTELRLSRSTTPAAPSRRSRRGRSPGT